MNHILCIKITILLIFNFIIGYQCALSEIEEKFIENNHKFSINFFKEITNKKNGSFIFSPFSLQSTGGLLYLGASDITAKEIYDGFKLVSNITTTVANSFYNITNKYKKDDDSILKIANGIFISNDYQLDPNISEISKQKFDIKVENIAFENANEASDKINNWVNKTTRGKIQLAVRPKNINSDTIMMLVNAITFKGQWKQKFDKSFTTETEFYSTPNKTTIVKMMYDKRHIKVGVDPKRNYVIGVFDFKNTDIVLQIIMPTKRKLSVEHIENLIINDGFKNITDGANLKETEADIEIPKFITKFEINLKEPYTNMGMESMFSEQANLKNFLKEKKLLKISKAIHKSAIEINEEGVEAASFTGYEFEDRIATGVLKFFKADQSFIYVLKGGNNEIYFMGRYVGEKNCDKKDERKARNRKG